MGKNVENWCLWCTEGQTDKHIKRTEANPRGNGSESLIVHVFELSMNVFQLLYLLSL